MKIEMELPASEYATIKRLLNDLKSEIESRGFTNIYIYAHIESFLFKFSGYEME